MTAASRRPARFRAGQTSLARLLPAMFRTILVVVLAIAIATGGVLAYLVGDLWPTSNRLHAGDRGLSQSFQSMLDEEAALRAYATTGVETLLDPRTRTAATVGPRDAAVVLDLSSDSALAPIVVEVKVAAAQWATGWVPEALERGKAVATTGFDSTDKTLGPFLATGQSLFDAYRAAEGRLHAAVLDKIDRLQSARRLLLAVILGVDLGLAAALVLMLVHDVRVIRRRVIEPVHDLNRAVAAIRAGELPDSLRADAVDELSGVDAGVASLGRSLVEERARVAERDAAASRHSAQLQLILGMAREIGGSVNMRHVVESIAQAAFRLGHYDRVRLWLLSDDERVLRLSHDTAAVGHGKPADRTTTLGEGLPGRTVRLGRLTHATDAEPDIAGEPVPAGAFAIPLVVGARTIGVLEMHAAPDFAFTTADQDILETLCVQAAVAIEASRLHARANEMAQVDPLTGLLNRRRLDEDLQLESERALRYGRAVAVIMIDLDFFKRINDTLGHQRADEVLQEVAGLLQQTVRADDTVYRYGGEELLVLARESTPEEAGRLAARLREDIEVRFMSTGTSGVTASFGVAGLPADATTVHSLIAQADRALYEAKRLGRNRVECASDLRASERLT
ncbi:MAG: putative Diguanylate cyclase [Frankiales bacterium]|nr:putative Diguanylate cyclase [Frankiales bacterium]